MNNKFIIALCLVGAYLINFTGTDSLIPGVPNSPVPGSGLHVLIVEDRLHRQDLPPNQFDAMMSSDVDEMIRKVDGHKYIYDQNQDLSTKNDPWVLDAMKVKRDKLPWVVLDKDGRGTSEALPTETRAFKELVEKYLQQ